MCSLTSLLARFEHIHPSWRVQEFFLGSQSNHPDNTVRKCCPGTSERLSWIIHYSVFLPVWLKACRRRLIDHRQACVHLQPGVPLSSKQRKCRPCIWA